MGKLNREWELWVRNNGSYGTENRYSCGPWQIVFNIKNQSGHIGKRGRQTIVQALYPDKGDIVKGLGIPDYVVDKANEVMKNKG